MTNDILYEAHGHVRLIPIDRADRMNSLDFAANVARYAGRKKIGDVIQTALDRADLPVDDGELLALAEEHVVEPIIPVAECQGAGGENAHVPGNARPVGFGEPPHLRREDVTEMAKCWQQVGEIDDLHQGPVFRAQFLAGT